MMMSVPCSSSSGLLGRADHGGVGGARLSHTEADRPFISGRAAPLVGDHVGLWWYQHHAGAELDVAGALAAVAMKISGDDLARRVVLADPGFVKPS
jgi:hypothetical protein